MARSGDVPIAVFSSPILIVAAASRSTVAPLHPFCIGTAADLQASCLMKGGKLRAAFNTLHFVSAIP